MGTGIEGYFIDRNSDPHGKGGNKTVWNHKRKPDLVVKEGSIGEKYPPEVLFRHYITNIVYLVTGGGVPESKFSFSKKDLHGVEKVDLGEEGDLIRNYEKKETGGFYEDPYVERAKMKLSTDPRIVELRKKLIDLKLPYLDDQPKNFGIGRDGRAVYVDEVMLLGEVGPFVEAVMPEIDKISDDEKRKRALIYLGRVNELLKKHPDYR